MRHTLRAVSVATMFAAVTVLSGSAALAQSDEAHIEYRQKVMQSLGSNMGAIADILKNRLPLRDNIALHARNLNTTAELILSAFDKRITEGRTDAKPEVWTDRAGFEEATQALLDESAKLVDAAQGGDMQALLAQVKATGDTCGGCHEDYRVPKEQSYRNR